MIAQKQAFGALRPDHFIAQSGTAGALVALTLIGDLVALDFAAQLSDWSVSEPDLKAVPCEGDVQTLLTLLGSSGSIALAEGSGGSGNLLLAMDQRALTQLIADLFGGAQEDGDPDPARGASKIEKSLASSILEALARSLERSLSAYSFGSMSFIGLVEGVEAKSFGDLANQMRIKISRQDNGGAFYLGLPRAAVEGFAEAYQGAQSAAVAAPDSVWRSRMQERVKLTDVTVEAILDGPTMTLGRLARLRPGQLIDLDAGPDRLIRLEYDGIPLYLAKLGQADGALSVSIELAMPAPRGKPDLGATEQPWMKS